ncbi:MAG: ABC transporter ATP-binding protein [Candidatus Woesearchaeota archaeon]
MSDNKEPVTYLWKKTWHFSKGNRKEVVIYIILSVIANMFSFLQPLVLAWLLNTIQNEGISQANVGKLVLICSCFILISGGFWMFHGPSRVKEWSNAFHVRANYKKYLVEGVLALPAEWHTEHHSGDTIDKIEKGTRGLYEFSCDTFEIIESIFRLISSTIALLYFNLFSGFFVLFFVIIAVTVVIQYDKRLRAYYREINHAENAASQKVFDFISNITTVIILRIEKLASSEIYKKIMSPFKVFTKNITVNEIKWSFVSLTSNCMIFSVLVAYIVRNAVSGETIMVGTVYALYGYVDRISDLFFRFAYKYGDILRQKIAVENAEEIANDFKGRSKPRSVSMSSWRRIQIKNLTFSYNSVKGKKQEKLHLKDINMTIKKGEKIALIGESGSGKTTFLKLIRGLYKPHKMELKLATKDGSKLLKDFNSISDGISLIPQDPELFTATIRENIVLGIECTDEELKKYTDLACFSGVVERLPKKLESNIKEKGVNLSGGEKQRLALSRGLLASKDKEIIMFDEPTSSVDSKNEMQIYSNIFARYPKKTIISSIHRLHLLPLFDTIYFFQNGKIIASGTFRQLLKNNKQFKDLWKKYHRQQKQGDLAYR